MAALEGGAPMTGDAFALEQQFHPVDREADIELLFNQGIGHRIVMPFDLDMVIDIDPGAFPLGVGIRLSG
jgi:hypothetical protein